MIERDSFGKRLPSKKRPTSAPALPRGAAEHTAGNKKVFGVNNGGGAPSPALVPGKRVTVGMGNHSKWLRSVGA